jgi:hypothetical protein
MLQDLEAAARYRNHANELRRLAETLSDHDARERLLNIAIEYDHLASVRERIHQQEGSR